VLDAHEHRPDVAVAADGAPQFIASDSRRLGLVVLPRHLEGEEAHCRIRMAEALREQFLCCHHCSLLFVGPWWMVCHGNGSGVFFVTEIA
jgi:hypothetical protein